ncbi:MAG: galactokinase [Chloroflexi bacterium]|nr:galactokinase [Chloroflexota bacterium]
MILARAPLRIPLGGGGTDLPSYYSQFGGFILSAAVNKYVYIYVNRPAADTLLRIKYSKYEETDRVDNILHDLVRPALQLLELDSALEIVSMADVPAGTGMGSSGSYLVALLTALYSFKRERVPIQALAEQACHIEMDLANHPVGKHDHYIAAFGGITCFDIQPDGKVHVSPLDIPIQVAEELRSSIVLFYTGMTRSSSQVLTEQKRDTEQGDAAVIDSLHRTREIGLAIKETLQKGDLVRFGQLLDEHWENKKRRSNKISDSRLDRLYEIAKESGALGGKIMGAGGGGFFMFFCPNSSKVRLREAMAAQGLREMLFDFDYEGAKVLVNF